MAGGLYEVLGISYIEVMQMPLADALIANLDALVVSRERAEAIKKARTER